MTKDTPRYFLGGHGLAHGVEMQCRDPFLEEFLCLLGAPIHACFFHLVPGFGRFYRLDQGFRQVNVKYLG